MDDYETGRLAAALSSATVELTIEDCTNSEEGDKPSEFCRGWNTYIVEQGNL